MITSEIKDTTKREKFWQHAKSLYELCYKDAVAKNLPQWYLEYVYQNGEATQEVLEWLNYVNSEDIITIFLRYLNWQHREEYLQVIRGESDNIGGLDNIFKTLVQG